MGLRFPAATLVLLFVTACSGASATPTTAPVPTSSTVPAAAATSTSTSTSTSTTTATLPVPTVAPPTTATTTTTTTTTLPAPPGTTAASRDVLAGRVVVLDPGHNGRNHAHPDEINRLVDIGTGTKACNTTGTATIDGFPEPRFNWEVAQKARAALEELGATVVFTRPDNNGWGPCIDERARIGNEAGADAVISIHADGGPEAGSGFHVIHPKSVAGLTDDIAEASANLARALNRAMRGTDLPVADYIGQDGFSVRDDLGGLNLSDVPIVFLEAGNMRNPADAARLTDPQHQAEIAGAITRAVVEFLAR